MIYSYIQRILYCDKAILVLYNRKGKAGTHGDEANRITSYQTDKTVVQALRAGHPAAGQTLDGADPRHYAGRAAAFLRDDRHRRRAIRSRLERPPARA